MQKAAWAVALVVVVGGAWLLYTQHGAAPAGTNTIKIGAVLSLTGIASNYGEFARNAMRLAEDDINRAGGIEGRPVAITFEDDHTDAAAAVGAFQKLTSVDGVSGVVGGLFDFATKPLFPVADTAQVALISPINFRIAGGFELTPESFVMMPDFNKVISQLKPYLAASNTKKLAVVHFKSVFGQEIADTLASVMGDLGRGPIVDESYTQIGGNDFKTAILKLKSEGVDTVFLDMVDVDPVNFLTRANELGYHPQIISYHGIIDSFSGPNVDKPLIEGAVILDWEFGGPAFTAKYKARYGVEPQYAAEKSYEAIYVMAQAIAATKSPAEVAPYLASHSFDTPSDTVSFNTSHAADTTPVRIEMVKNGVLVPIE